MSSILKKRPVNEDSQPATASFDVQASVEESNVASRSGEEPPTKRGGQSEAGDQSVAQLDVADAHSDNGSNKIRDDIPIHATNQISDEEDSDVDEALSAFHETDDGSDILRATRAPIKREWLKFRPNTNHHPRVGSDYQADI
jgi:hypothetical protein